ncbi:interleukin-3 [Mesocricetus auratus]|uniref:Interleukin-3 n=1 Tax=Mesocricetus auratus TaxID=10036 RepID=A0ABM2XQM2_MESAU|nr:interleukin-3 [Mesocricetus auratus]
MALASSTTSVLSVLLLHLMLFHQGRQSPVMSPVMSSDTSRSTSDEAYSLNCSLMAMEIVKKLPEINFTDLDARAILRAQAITPPAPPSSHLPRAYTEDSLPSQNITLQRVNLCEFLKMRRKLEEEKLEVGDIKSNLEKLADCLPPAVSTSRMTGIYLEKDLEDFQRKLRFYVSQLSNLLPEPRPPHSSSDSVTSRPVAMECENS